MISPCQAVLSANIIDPTLILHHGSQTMSVFLDTLNTDLIFPFFLVFPNLCHPLSEIFPFPGSFVAGSSHGTQFWSKRPKEKSAGALWQGLHVPDKGDRHCRHQTIPLPPSCLRCGHDAWTWDSHLVTIKKGGLQSCQPNITKLLMPDPQIPRKLISEKAP